MPKFYFVPEDFSDGKITIYGEDVNHLKNVLRMREGDELVLCDGEGRDYKCVISSFTKDSAMFTVLSGEASNAEIPVKIALYQGIPKKDKMELIIQKAVELGAAEIVPVAMKRCIAKIEDAKSEKKKLERWNEISKAAAKQSGRGIIPEVGACLGFKEALEKAKNEGCLIGLAYENAEGIASLSAFTDMMKSDTDRNTVLLIGPEGGFDVSEVELAKEYGAHIISLGKRILRTETAGLAALSIFMYELEKQNGMLS